MNVAAKEGISPTTDCTITPSQWLMVSLPVHRSREVDAVNLSCSPARVAIHKVPITKQVFLFALSRAIHKSCTCNETWKPMGSTRGYGG